MARIAMFGEARTLEGDGFFIHDGVPSSSSRVGGIGTSPQGNTSVFAHRILEDQRYYPTFVTKQWATPVTEGWMRFHYYGNAFNRAEGRRMFGLRLGAPGSSVPILNVAQDDLGSNFLCGLHLYNSTGSLIANIASNIHDLRVIYLWEVHVRLDPTNGLFELYQDGILRLSYSGPLVGPGGETTFDTFGFGAGVPLEGADPGIYNQGATASNSARTTIDNFALNDVTGTINNGRIGDGLILRLTPNGNGGFSQLTNRNGTSVDNYKHAARGEDGWVYPTGVGQRDSYLVSRPDIEFGAVNALMFQAQVAANGPTYNNVRFSMKPTGQADFQAAGADPIPVDAVTDLDADTPLVQRIIEVNPNTAGGFTIAEVDGCEAGLAFEA